MPPPASYAISLRFPKSFIKNSIQDTLENEREKLKREERELLTILEADFMGLIHNPSGDEINPSIYEYMSASKDEYRRELKKKKEEQNQSKPPSDKLTLKIGLLVALTR